jgi:hypothetical protein
MSFSIKSIEWRKTTGAWHLFMTKVSICGRAGIRDNFTAAEEKPPTDGEICQWCVKEAAKLKNRVNSII